MYTAAGPVVSVGRDMVTSLTCTEVDTGDKHNQVTFITSKVFK